MTNPIRPRYSFIPPQQRARRVRPAVQTCTRRKSFRFAPLILSLSHLHDGKSGLFLYPVQEVELESTQFLEGSRSSVAPSFPCKNLKPTGLVTSGCPLSASHVLFGNRGASSQVYVVEIRKGWIITEEWGATVLGEVRNPATEERRVTVPPNIERPVLARDTESPLLFFSPG